MRSLVFGDKNLAIVANQKPRQCSDSASGEALVYFLLAPELFRLGNWELVIAPGGLLYQIKLADVGGRLVKTHRQAARRRPTKKEDEKTCCRKLRKFQTCSASGAKQSPATLAKSA